MSLDRGDHGIVDRAGRSCQDQAARARRLTFPVVSLHSQPPFEWLHPPLVMTSPRFALSVLLILAAGCAGKEAPAAQPDASPATASIDTLPSAQRGPALSPLADTIGQALVFLPRDQTWFTAAARGKRMLLDLGRVDVEVRKDSARALAYRQVVASRAPVTVGSRLRLYGPWGADDVEVSGFDSWNGRIVATLTVPPHVDSLAKVVEPLPAVAVRVNATAPSMKAACMRDSITPEHRARLTALRDSIEAQLRADAVPPFERLVASVTVKTTMAHGCYGRGRTLMISSLRAGAHEFVREKIVLVAEDGSVVPVRMVASRWRAHEAIYALDADGDGSDDLAVRGSSDRAGGLVVLELHDGNRLEKLAGGFNWEAR